MSLLTPEIAEIRWKEYERLHSLLSAAGFEDGTIQDSGLKPPPTLEELEEEAELRESIDQYIRETWNLEYE